MKKDLILNSGLAKLKPFNLLDYHPRSKSKELNLTKWLYNELKTFGLNPVFECLGDVPEDNTGEIDCATCAYVHEQNTTSAGWIIIHNLGFFPNVRVQTSAGIDVVGDVTYLDENSLRVTFSSAFQGKAYLS